MDNKNTPSSVGEILGEAISLYAKAPLLFILVSFFPAIFINSIGHLTLPVTESVYLEAFKATVITSVLAGFHASTFYLVWCASRQKPLLLPYVPSIVIAFGPRLFLVALLLSATALLIIPTVFGIFIAIYAGVRLCLIRPFIMIESMTPLQAARSSWHLVEGKWLQTFAIQFIVLAFSAIVFAFGALIGSLSESVWLALLLQSLIQSLLAPLAAGVDLALFDEYKSS